MNIDQKSINEMMQVLGINSSNASEVVNSYKSKNEQELVSEIMRVKQTLMQNPEKYRKQLAMVKSLRGMFKGEQRERLDWVISVLESD